MGRGDRRQAGTRPTTHTRRRVQAGAALCSGVVGAALLCGGVPLAAAAKPPTGIGQTVNGCFGAGKQIVQTLGTASITADGTTTSTATATVTATGGTPCAGQQVAFSSSDTKQAVGAIVDHGDGTYTAAITSSKTAGQATITARLTVLNGGPPPLTIYTSATATLTQTAGPATRIALLLSPTSIPADGTSTLTGTASLTDANGNPVLGHTVTFSTSDPGDGFSAVDGHRDGTYTVTITSSTTPEPATISATDSSTSPNLTAHAPLTESAVGITVPATGAAAERHGGYT
jgi:adhesin/invasin